MRDRLMTTDNNKNSNQPSNKKKWLALMSVGLALLLLPRRSSRKDTHAEDKITTKDEDIS